jgi:hypothetical protein
MHQAIRLKIPASSPPNLEKALRVLEREGFNIVAVGGSDHEMGGEFSFAVPHGKEQGACDALRKAGYDDAHIVDVYTEDLDDRPGALAAAVAKARARNEQSGKAIKDIAVGVKLPNGKVPIQIYSE